MKGVTALTLWLLSVVIVIVAFNALPDGIRWWGWGFAIVVGGVLFLRSWWKRQKELHKIKGDANELEWLDELAKEHEEGIRDNREKIEWLIGAIEKKHELSDRVSEHLYNARLAIDPKLDPKRLLAELKASLKDEAAKMKDEMQKKM